MVAGGQTFERVVGIISEVLEVDVQDLGDETTFEDLSTDSLDILEIVTSIEDEFGIAVPDDALDSVQTVGDAATLVEEILE